ncbi:hypothetical protein DOK78_001781 [Enterococcus sp. DIV2402]|uniref:DUF1349 domain-containing protein n=1 Tax=Candidatus Enterococcus lowellii TaxID=2230877 RepID=A0ABZ2SMV1_9ENTE|nr:DUF1349 domain-containing protein [Enterococcus sp. DIV2402]
MKFSNENLRWTNQPKEYEIADNRISITTEPHTDFWQRTFYGFRNDNAPALQLDTEEEYFSFTVKTRFNTQTRFDQCGIIVYLDSDNWLKASSEYKNNETQRLGSVVTNLGYSDWATMDISSKIDTIWYRLSRRKADYRLDYSLDGVEFKQMRICHLHQGKQKISFGIYACSPEQSSFQAVFSEFEITECLWKAHV